MSGHSKWATTKRKKAAVDAKRGQLFTKLAKIITIAARNGGDPASNSTLRMAIDNAKSFSLPKENIERAILRGSGGGEGASIEEITYEAYGPGGVAVMVECLTDNKNRTLAELKSIMNKLGGNIASPGSVSYQFEKRGLITVDEEKNSVKGEELELIIIDSGAFDFEKEDRIYFIYTNLTELNQVKSNLEEYQVIIESAEPTLLPQNYIELDDETKAKVTTLLEAIDEMEDVNKVYTNANL